jgi:hypothetical protein
VLENFQNLSAGAGGAHKNTTYNKTTFVNSISGDTIGRSKCVHKSFTNCDAKNQILNNTLSSSTSSSLLDIAKKVRENLKFVLKVVKLDKTRRTQIHVGGVFNVDEHQVFDWPRGEK